MRTAIFGKHSNSPLIHLYDSVESDADVLKEDAYLSYPAEIVDFISVEPVEAFKERYNMKHPRKNIDRIVVIHFKIPVMDTNASYKDWVGY